MVYLTVTFFVSNGFPHNNKSRDNLDSHHLVIQCFMFLLIKFHHEEYSDTLYKKKYDFGWLNLSVLEFPYR